MDILCFKGRKVTPRGEGGWEKIADINVSFVEWGENILQIAIRDVTIDGENVQITPVSRRFSTQKIRKDLVRSLRQLHILAQNYSKDETQDPISRERWGRLAAYTGQTINVILNAYDEVQIEQTLHDLKEYVKEHVKTPETLP